MNKKKHMLFAVYSKDLTKKELKNFMEYINEIQRNVTFKTFKEIKHDTKVSYKKFNKKGGNT